MPPFPSSVSLPACPKSWSAPEPPVRVSSSAPPNRFAAGSAPFASLRLTMSWPPWPNTRISDMLATFGVPPSDRDRAAVHEDPPGWIAADHDRVGSVVTEHGQHAGAERRRRRRARRRAGCEGRSHAEDESSEQSAPGMSGGRCHFLRSLSSTPRDFVAFGERIARASNDTADAGSIPERRPRSPWSSRRATRSSPERQDRLGPGGISRPRP